MEKNISQENSARICTGFPLNFINMEDSSAISEILKDMGVTPYIYVRYSLKRLVEGSYNEAFKLIEFAGSFDGKYYTAGSVQNKDYVDTITLMRYLVLHLADEFTGLSSMVMPEQNHDNR
jgi:hypothetical protein